MTTEVTLEEEEEKEEEEQRLLINGICDLIMKRLDDFKGSPSDENNIRIEFNEYYELDNDTDSIRRILCDRGIAIGKTIIAYGGGGGGVKKRDERSSHGWYKVSYMSDCEKKCLQIAM